MELMFFGVTVVALASAVGLSVFAWRLLRADDQRREARVETLVALAAVDAPLTVEPAMPFDVIHHRENFVTPQVDLASGFDAWREPGGARQSEGMFRASDERGTPGRRWVALAAVGVVMMLGVVGTYSVMAAPRAHASASASAAATSAPVTHPLELLSLRHEFAPDGAFTITGLVQNPLQGAIRRHVLAVAYLFDSNGHNFAGGRVPIASADLAPGDQAPFVIRVPNVSHVARYRVGFRTDDGVVVAHVDKRGQPLAGTTANAVGSSRAVGAK